jgi:hypothetical protein
VLSTWSGARGRITVSTGTPRAGMRQLLGSKPIILIAV